MATATTAVIHATGNTGGAVMMMPTGNSIAMVLMQFQRFFPNPGEKYSGCAGQPSEVPLYPSQQSAYSIYPSQAVVGVSSANSRLLSNICCDASSINFFNQQQQQQQQQQQSYQLQRSVYQNLTPEPPATTSNNVMPQIMNCEAVGSITSATMSSDSLTATVLTDLGSQTLPVLRPSSRSRPSSSCSSVTNVQIPIANSTVTATSTTGTVTKNMEGLVIASVTDRTASSGCATTNSDILIIRDPFEEEELAGIRNATNTQTMFNQRPPQYINTGNPLDSGGQLELPRHLRVPYPESAYRACIAANKNLDSYRNGPPLSSFIPPYPVYSGSRPGSVLATSAVARDNSVMYGSLQQHQQHFSGSGANFGIIRNNNRAQENVSPGCPSLSAGNATAPQSFGNSYCVQRPPSTQQILGPPGCTQRGNYLTAASGSYRLQPGTAGQAYFGDRQPISIPEPGTSGVVPLNTGPHINPVGMISMNDERVGPVMGVSVAQQAVATGKKGSNKRSKANKAAATVSNVTVTDEQQLLFSRRKQQPLLPCGQQQLPVVPGMMLPVSVSSQFYLSQGICGNRSGIPHHVAPPQQQAMIPMTPNGTSGSSGLGQFDHFDVRPSTSMSCTPISCSPSLVSAPNVTDTHPQQQSTSQMIANSMMMTRGYGSFEQNGFVDGFQTQRSNGNNGDTTNNNMASNATVTTTASDDSFTVLNGSSHNTSTDNKQRCVSCAEELRSDQSSIQCTANGEGCRRFFHQECSGLLSDAFRAILAEPCAEWICPDCLCRQQTQLTFA